MHTMMLFPRISNMLAPGGSHVYDGPHSSDFHNMLSSRSSHARTDCTPADFRTCWHGEVISHAHHDLDLGVIGGGTISGKTNSEAGVLPTFDVGIGPTEANNSTSGSVQIEAK